MGKSDAPEPPNPKKVAEAQFDFYRQAARESALLNQMGIFSPWGRQFYTGEIGSPDRTMHIELSPEQQRILGFQQDLALQMLPDITGRLMSDESIEDALYQRGLNRLMPDFEEREAALESRLAGGGIPIGSRAYEQAMGQFGEERADAMENLALSSQIVGAQEERARRMQAMQELAGILGQFQNPATMMPGQQQIGAPDFASLAQNQYLGELNAYNTQAQQLGGLYSLLGLVGAGFMF